MSQGNVELVRRGIQSVETFWTLLDEHVVWDLRAYPVLDLDGVYVGRDAVIKASRHYWGTWHEYRLDAEQFIDAGSSVVIAVRERGRGRGSGAPFDQRWAQVWTFSRGRIIRWELFPDTARALEAVGMSEQDAHADS
jgi:ketosteroid isomerase-like protein